MAIGSAPSSSSVIAAVPLLLEGATDDATEGSVELNTFPSLSEHCDTLARFADVRPPASWTLRFCTWEGLVFDGAALFRGAMLELEVVLYGVLKCRDALQRAFQVRVDFSL